MATFKSIQPCVHSRCKRVKPVFLSLQDLSNYHYDQLVNKAMLVLKRFYSSQREVFNSSQQLQVSTQLFYLGLKKEIVCFL